MQKQFDLQNRLVKYSAGVLIACREMKSTPDSKHLQSQLIRSSTSPALNYGEAQAAESRKDFLHKMQVCLKELRESQVNLQIIKEAGLCAKHDAIDSALEETSQLIAIFAKSVKTARANFDVRP